ncbi:MAG: lactate racemase domain-containing protein [bacterium]
MKHNSNNKIHISYGNEKKEISIPDSNLAGFLKPSLPVKRIKPEDAFNSALNEPIGNVKLEDITRGKKVCVTIEDYTRSEPHKEIVLSISRRLTEASSIQYIIVTGTHNPLDERNLRIKSVIEDIASNLGLRFDIAINDARDSEQFEYIGTTKRRTKVLVNKKALDADVYISGADMKPHYFAGYSAANKHFLPGICAFETIRQNHCGLIKDEMSNYGRHPWHYNEKRQNNPLVDDMIEAMQLILKGKPAFTLAMITDGDVLWCKAGLIEQVTREGIKRADEIFSFTIEPVKYLVVSPGGSPEDNYLYSGQRALELTSEAVIHGGEVLWISKCALGIHTGVNQQEIDDFYNAELLDFDSLTSELDKPDVKFHVYKAYRFKRLLKKIHVYGYSSLDRSVLSAINIEPVNDPQDAINKWLANDLNAKILVIDKANKMAIFHV